MKAKLFQNDIPDDLNIEGNLAIDTETMGLNIKRDRLCLLQMSDEDGNVYLVQFVDKNYLAPNLTKLLLDNQRKKIFHFARFDIAVIKHYLNIELKNIFCTKIASRLVRTYSDYHGLKDLCRELLQISISKNQQSSNWGQSQLTEEQIKYAANDVLYLHKICGILSNMLIDQDKIVIFKEICDFLRVRINLDLLGWRDVDIFEH
ncbi:MAG: ribonuclease D [Rickettsiaceae bacterium]